jgi:hypothetical protein
MKATDAGRGSARARGTSETGGADYKRLGEPVIPTSMPRFTDGKKTHGIPLAGPPRRGSSGAN